MKKERRIPPILPYNYNDDEVYKQLKGSKEKIKIEYEAGFPIEFKDYFDKWFTDKTLSDIPDILEKVHNRIYKFPVLSTFTGEIFSKGEANMKIHANKNNRLILETMLYTTRRGLIYPFLQVKSGVSSIVNFDQFYFKGRKSLFPKFPINSLKGSLNYKRLFPNDLKFTLKSSISANSALRISSQRTFKQKAKLNFFDGDHSIRISKIDDFSRPNLNYLYNSSQNGKEENFLNSNLLKLSFNSQWRDTLLYTKKNLYGSSLFTKLDCSFDISKKSFKQSLEIEGKSIFSLYKDAIFFDSHCLIALSNRNNIMKPKKSILPIYGGWEKIHLGKINSQFSFKALFLNYPLISDLGVVPFLHCNIQNPQDLKLTSGLGLRLDVLNQKLDFRFNMFGYSKDKTRNSSFEINLIN